MIELRCHNCDRYLPLTLVDTTVTIIKCSNSKCKAPNAIKFITEDANQLQLHYKFTDTKLARTKEVKDE